MQWGVGRRCALLSTPSHTSSASHRHHRTHARRSYGIGGQGGTTSMNHECNEYGTYSPGFFALFPFPPPKQPLYTGAKRI